MDKAELCGMIINLSGQKSETVLVFDSISMMQEASDIITDGLSKSCERDSILTIIKITHKYGVFHFDASKFVSVNSLNLLGADKNDYCVGGYSVN